MVFRFGTVKTCPTIEEYASLIGVPYNCEKVIVPCLESSFKDRLLKTLWIKKNFFGGEGNYLNTKDALWNCFVFRMNPTSLMIDKSAFSIDHQMWAYNQVKALKLSILGHILLPKESTYIGLGLLKLMNRSNKALPSFQAWSPILSECWT